MAVLGLRRVVLTGLGLLLRHMNNISGILGPEAGILQYRQNIRCVLTAFKQLAHIRHHPIKRFTISRFAGGRSAT